MFNDDENQSESDSGEADTGKEASDLQMAPWMHFADPNTVFDNYPMKISTTARETMQECVTEFLLFVTSEAAEMCFEDGRKTINGEDVVKSM